MDINGASRLAIGSLNENSIHKNLKHYYSPDSRHHEQPIDSYIVDVLLHSSIIEIQTGNFGSIKKKLSQLLKTHQVKLVYPYPKSKYIVKVAANTTTIVSRRKSPKKGTIYNIFRELLRIAPLITNPNLELEVLLTEEEECWLDDNKGSWRRKGWSKFDRKLLSIAETRQFRNKNDYLSLLPENLPITFTTKNISVLSKIPLHIAQHLKLL